MKEFDIIVIGGGSGGSAAAGRLAESGKYSVCLFEAGGKNNGLSITTPAMLAFMPSKSSYVFETVPQKGLNGRSGLQPRGRGLGGSSAINAMVYIRGAKWDYDNWAKMGCDGWAYEDVLPYFKRAEHNEDIDDEFHGRGGPLNVMRQGHPHDGSKAFVAAAANLQLPINDDFNGAQLDGFGLYQVTQKGGERWSASRAYVEPAAAKGKLHVETGELVQRIVVENGRAVGIEVKRGSTSEVIRARGAVILSAGTFHSPQILQLSGLGPAQLLKDNGIDVVVDRPQVGQNLQDHIDYISRFTASKGGFLGPTLSGAWKMAIGFIEHRIKRTGLMTSPYAEAGGFWKTDPRLPAPDIQYHFLPVPLENHGRGSVRGNGYACHACVLRPKSRGSVTIGSASAADAPVIDPNFLDNPDDIKTLRAGIRQMHRIMEAPPMSEYNGVDAWDTPLDDDVALDELIRNRADTIYHPAGSCRMGKDKDAVVDTNLKFNEVEGLYIADASIMPALVSGNTNAPSIMIGERCADFVQQQLS